jgi:hypothetical protein
VDCVFNTPNDKSRPGYLKMGWHEVGKVPVSVRLTGLRSIPKLAGARTAAEMWSDESSVGRPAGEVLADRDAVEALLARIGNGSRISTDRTPEFLHWRYRFAPLRYRAVSLGRGVEDGLVVFRVRKRGTATEATICEVLAPEGASTKTAWKALKGSGVDYLLKGSAAEGRLHLADARGGSCRSRRWARSSPGARSLTRWCRRWVSWLWASATSSSSEAALPTDLQQAPVSHRSATASMAWCSSAASRSGRYRSGSAATARTAATKPSKSSAGTQTPAAHRREGITHAANVGGNGRNADEGGLDQHAGDALGGAGQQQHVDRSQKALRIRNRPQQSTRRRALSAAERAGPLVQLVSKRTVPGHEQRGVLE